MRLRLSNGYSMAVEFTATNENEFTKNKKIALLQYCSVSGEKMKSAAYQLHIRAANGDWLPFNYGSNLSSAGRARGEWEKCIHAFGGAEKLDQFLIDAEKMIRISPPKLTIIEPQNE